MLRTLIKERLFFFTFAVTLSLALFLHFWKIGSAPRGFTVDECAIGYNAYCIARTGADEYGTSWPLFFRSFDVYCDPADVYSAALSIRAFGLEKWAARLPTGLYCLFTCIAFSTLLRQWQMGAPLSVAGGFLLSVIPWVFPLSRNCSFGGHIAALLGLVTGLVLTSSALRRKSTWRAVLAGATWGLTFYAHQSVQPVLVMLAIGCTAVLWRRLVPRWWQILVMALSALVILLPLIISVLRSPEGLTARFHQVSITSEAISPRDVIVSMTSRYVDYFSPRFLFISGDPRTRHHTGHGGELYWCLAPLILIGTGVAVRHCRQHASYRIILVGVLVSPVTAAFTVDPMHSTRAMYAVVFWLALAVLGAQWLWQRRRSGRTLLLVIACAGAVEIALYMQDYFGPYQTRDPQALQTELTDAFEYCFAHLKTNQVLYISASTYTPYGAIVNTELKPQLYIYALFFGEIDPAIYQRTGLPKDIVQLYDGHAAKSGLLLKCNNYYQRRPEGVYLEPDPMPIPPHAALIKTIPFSGLYSFASYQIFAVPE